MKMDASMMDELEETYKERLESSIVTELSRRLGLDASAAMELYYRSSLAGQIDRGEYGIQYLSPDYLVDDLLENEGDLFYKFDELRHQVHRASPPFGGAAQRTGLTRRLPCERF